MRLAKINEGRGKTCPVGDAGEEKLRCFVKLVLEALLSDAEYVCDVGHGQELLHVVQAVRLRIRIRELRVDLRLAQRLARHLQEANEVVVLAGTVGDVDDLGEVGWIRGLDVRICKG